MPFCSLAVVCQIHPPVTLEPLFLGQGSSFTHQISPQLALICSTRKLTLSSGQVVCNLMVEVKIFHYRCHQKPPSYANFCVNMKIDVE